MADLSELSDIDISNIAPIESREPFPPGEYDVMCVESEIATSKNGNLLMLKLTWKIISGSHENRKIFDNVNVKCFVTDDGPQKAAEIGKRTLRTLCDIFQFNAIPSESCEFHDKPIKAKVAIRKGSNGFKDSNEIDWAATAKLNGVGAESHPPTAPAAAAPQQKTPAPGPAWKRKST
ncbi:hypothetical protein BH11ARM1_BH11ARM1_04530 [soil metagenome]